MAGHASQRNREAYCTGEADPYDKFLAFAKTVPATLRNPLFHWTHLELKRYFGIDTLLNEESAPEIWEEANRQLAQPSHSAWGILEQFKVQFIGTTDDPSIHSSIIAPWPHRNARLGWAPPSGRTRPSGWEISSPGTNGSMNLKRLPDRSVIISTTCSTRSTIA
jgi:hypothetical protein